MFAITSILVLACAVAINALTLLPTACSSAQIGNPSPLAHKLDRVYLSPGVADWEVKIPAAQQCPSGVSGETAFSCDGDVPPTAKFVSEESLYVHRNGRLADYAFVDITIYCIVGQPSYNNPLSWDGGLSSPKLYDQQPLGLIARPQ